jgi:hypothetical protein
MKNTYYTTLLATGLLLATTHLAMGSDFVNGGFEDGLTGWTDDGIGVTSPALAGENSAYFAPAGEVSQTISVSPGGTYLVQYDAAKSGWFACSDIEMVVKAGGTPLTLSGYGVALSGPEGFQEHGRFFYHFTVPAGVNSVTVTFKDVPQGEYCAGETVLDAVSLHTIVINSQPAAGYAVSVGSSLNLSVSASGTPTLSYQWKVNGASISGATGSSLSLSNLQQTNSGSYTVVISNASDSIETAPGELTVAGELVNGGFENGLTGWTYTSGVYLQSPGLAGNNCAVVNIPEVLSQAFAVIPGHTYNLQFDYANGTPEDWEVSWDITTPGHWIEVDSTSTPIEGPEGFWGHTRVVANFTVPTGVTAVFISFTDRNWPSGNSPVYDSVSVSEE